MITKYFGWRWVFLVNVPASAILVAGALKFIGESRDPNAKRLDVLGTVTFSAGLALLIWALIAVTRKAPPTPCAARAMFSSSELVRTREGHASRSASRNSLSA